MDMKKKKKKKITVNSMDVLATRRVLRKMAEVSPDAFTRSTIELVLKLVQRVWESDIEV
jgi:hypothetical protein